MGKFGALVFLFFGFLISLLGAQAHAADFVIDAVAISTPDDEDADGLNVFKAYVEAASNGHVQVNIHLGAKKCLNGEDCLNKLRDGAIDIYVSTSGGAAKFFPYIQILDLPYLMDDDRVAERVLSGNFVRFLRQKILADSDNSIRLMTIGNTGGWRNFANVLRPIRVPSDMKGMKIRTVVADLPQQLVKTLGGEPVPVVWSDLYGAFEQGSVDGSKNGLTDIMSMGFPKAGLKYITEDRHAYMGAFWYMNNQRFLNFPEDLRLILIDGFVQLQQATFASPKRKAIAAQEAFLQQGGHLYSPSAKEKAQFKVAVLPVYQWFKANVGDGEIVFETFVQEIARASAAIGADRRRDTR